MEQPLPSRSGPPPSIDRWVWKLFTGEAYPYIRRTLKHEKGAPPTHDDILQKFNQVYEASVVKTLVMELVGLGLEFQELSTHAHGTQEFTGLMRDPIGSLARAFGGGKFKLCFYYGDQFVATQNFKVPGQPKWNITKCLTSILDTMETKARRAKLEVDSFPGLIEQLCRRHALEGSAQKMEAPQFLKLLQDTVGNQYEDYFSQVLKCEEAQAITDYFMQRLAELYGKRPAR